MPLCHQNLLFLLNFLIFKRIILVAYKIYMVGIKYWVIDCCFPLVLVYHTSSWNIKSVLTVVPMCPGFLRGKILQIPVAG